MNRDKYIIENLRKHYNECEKLGYEIFGVFLQGSQNYELDVYNEIYQSDIDTKAIFLPSFDSFAKNNSKISTTHILDNNEHIDLKDIYTMFETFKKQNINFVEILFTPYFITNPKYEDLILELRNNADKIVSSHFNQSLRCLSGMSMEKLKALCHPYPSIVDKIEKYGYDPKQLHTLARLNIFIKDFTSGKPYRDCLITTKENRDWLIELKTIPVELEEAKELATTLDKETNEIKNNNLQVPEIVCAENYKILDDIRIKALKRYFREELLNE